MSQQVAVAGGTPTVEGDPLFSWANKIIPPPPLPGGYLTSDVFWVAEFDWITFKANASGATTAGSRWIFEFFDGPDAHTTPPAVVFAKTWDIAKAKTLMAGLRVLGAWCRVTCYANPDVGGGFPTVTASLAVYGEHAPVPAAIVPDAGPLLFTSSAVPANTTAQVFGAFPYAGRAHLFAFVPTGLFVSLFSLRFDGTLTQIDQWRPDDAAYRAPREILVPPAILRADLQNTTGGALTPNLALVPVFEGG